jgi:ribosomal protein S1
MTLVGNNKKYRMGDSIDIVVVFASRETRKIDFMLKEDYNRTREDDFIENYMYK